MLRWLVFLMFAGVMTSVGATCTTDSVVDDTGTNTAWTLSQGRVSATLDGGMHCSAVKSGSAYLKLKVESSTNNFFLVDSTGHKLAYRLATSATGSQLAVNSEQILLSGVTPLTSFSGPNSSIPLFFTSTQTSGVSDLAPGVYEDTITLRWYYSIPETGSGGSTTYSNSTGFQRPVGTTNLDWGTGDQLILTVRMTVTASCNISDYGTINFESQPLVRKFEDKYASVTVTCSAGTTYSLGLSDGLHYDASTGKRRMVSAAGNYIIYDVYKADGTTRWGSTGADRWESVDVTPAATNADQRVHEGVAKVMTGQSTPPVGTYSDTLTVEVKF